MVTGNFALLAGVAPAQIEDWYLAVYADAYDWVELPNVHGRVMHADGGRLGSRPYAASGACSTGFMSMGFMARRAAGLAPLPQGWQGRTASESVSALAFRGRMAKTGPSTGGPERVGPERLGPERSGTARGLLSARALAKTGRSGSIKPVISMVLQDV